MTSEIQTKELSILPSFYFHEVLQQLKTFIYTNFRFERVLRFVIFPGFYVTRHLAGGRKSSYVGEKHDRFFEILLSKHSLSQNKYYFNLYEFLKR